MTELYENNTITGGWVSYGANYGIVTGQVTEFAGTVTATGESFTATSFSAGVTAAPPGGGASAGGFTFNGPIDSFAGWSAGVEGSAGVHAEYQMTTDGHSLVMYGAGASLSVSATVSYTWINEEEMPDDWGDNPLDYQVKPGDPLLHHVPGPYASPTAQLNLALAAGEPGAAIAWAKVIGGENWREVLKAAANEYVSWGPDESIPTTGNPWDDMGHYSPPSGSGSDDRPGDSIRETSDKIEAILEQGGPPGKAAAAVVNAGAEIAATIVDIGAGLINKAIDVASRTEVIQTPAGPKVVVKPPESSSGGSDSSPPPPPKPTPPKDHPQKDEDLGGTPPPSKPTSPPDDKYGRPYGDPGYVGPQPVILDLDGNGIQITEAHKSNIFVDAGGDGLKHRTAWAAAGNGVLFFDAGNDGQITEKREYVFTEWDPSADSDFAALRSRFDSNGDGKLTAADAEFASFKVMVTNADGSQTAMTLAQLGITEISLTPDATQIRLPDGSAITGQASFVINGQSRIAADTVLVAEGQGHNVTQVVSTDGSGNRVVVSTAYAANGDVAYVITSVTNPAGTNITNSYDDNGDGVLDRIQTIVKVTNGDGSVTETVTNYAGASVGAGVLMNREATTVSANGLVTTIERDSSGGGWYDSREVRTTLGDGSRTLVVQELAQSGAVIRSSSETVSVDGFARTNGIDQDGNGAADTVTSQGISTVSGVRTETVSVTNGDASLRAGSVEVTSADGRTKTLTTDLDGDGDADRVDASTVVLGAGNATTTTMTVRNGDNSLRAQSVVTQSGDSLTKTAVKDVDGDGDTDSSVANVTVVNGDGSRVETTTVTNGDGSVRSKVEVALGADKVSGTTKVDLNQDGVFQATDLVRSLVVDAGTGVRTETVYARNVDGTVRGQAVTVTSADGLSVTSSTDAEGDGDTDSVVTDVTAVVAGQAVRTVEVRNQDNSLRTATVATTSADGLTTTVKSDIDGNGTWDAQSVDVRANLAGGAISRTVSDYAGDGTTLMGRSESVESGDRRTKTITTDSNGDGAADRVTQSVEDAAGATTVTTSVFAPNGVLTGKSVSTLSANGLVATSLTDANGDLVNETAATDTTVLNADGSRSRTIDVNNGDGKDRSLSVTTVSDDGLITTVETDADGNNAFERTQVSTSVLNANGSVTRTDEVKDQAGLVMSRTVTTTSDDGLITTVQSDADADGDFDLTSTQTTVLLANGGTTTTSELRDQTNVLRSKTVQSVSDDGRNVTNSADVNGDGQNDVIVTRVLGDDGILTVTETRLGVGGVLQSKSESVTSDDGLTTTVKWDRDGDGTYERATTETAVLNADGSVTRTAEGRGVDGDVYTRSSTTVSDHGLTTTRSDDLDGDGLADLTTMKVVSRAANGVETQTTTHRARNNALVDQSVMVISADKRTVTESSDLDGNGVNDLVRTTVLDNTGKVTSTTNFYSDGGALEAKLITSSSADGLTTTKKLDRNGDGRFDLNTSDVTTLNADGTVKREVTYTSDRYVVLGREETVTSDDGLTVTKSIDHNGDGAIDFITKSQTVLESDGDVVTTAKTTNGYSELRSNIVTTQSGDGLSTTIAADYSGDGDADRITTIDRTADGASTTVVEQFGTNHVLQEQTTETISADGRTRTVVQDLNGDGFVDRKITSVADLSQTTVSTFEEFYPDGSLQSRTISTVSANGMDSDYAFDLDGDGVIDITRGVHTTFGEDGSQIVTASEIHGDRLGYREVTVTAANGLTSTTSYDVDGDGEVDGTATMVTTLNADGSKTTVEETRYADGTLRSKSEQFVSADGRTISSKHDYDGNGVEDKRIETTMGADGSTVSTVNTYNKGGMQTQTSTTRTSADGLETTTDYDWASYSTTNATGGNKFGSLSGHGSYTSAAGRVGALDTHGINGFYTGGANGFLKSLQARDRNKPAGIDDDPNGMSVLGNGTYTWDNGVTAGVVAGASFAGKILSPGRAAVNTADAARFTNIRVTHEVDAQGIDTWTVVRTWKTSTGGENPVISNQSDTTVVRLDIAAKAQVMAEAARIYDTVLDRDMDKSEIEQLALKIKDGQLDQAALATDLVALPEVTDRYGTMSNGEYITQIYLNALGRAPSMEELNYGLKALAGGGVDMDGNAIPSLTRGTLALEVSESMEHLLVGNGHLATNNLDVIMNPAGFERTVDRAWAESIVKAMVDVMYDRDATAQEVDYLSSKLLADTSNPDDLVAILRGVPGDIQGVSSKTLTGLSGTALVNQAYLNALGRLPSASERETWEVNLSSNTVTADQFIASLAMSSEKTAIGNTHLVNAAPTVNTITGGSGNDSILGTAGQDSMIGGAGNDTLIAVPKVGVIGVTYGATAESDVLVGGLGNDLLVGGNGSDIYIWSKGDGNDTIKDWETGPNGWLGGSKSEGDTLVLTDVVTSDVILSRLLGTDHLQIRILSTGEVITVDNQMDDLGVPWGIEAIKFADGTIWDLDKIKDETRTYGDAGNNNISRANFQETVYGLGGDDTIETTGGDDKLIGGTGNDQLKGGAGNDTYVWSRGDGADTINDSAENTLDVDRLILTDVSASDVTITDVGGNKDIIVHVAGPDGAQILIKDRDYEIGGVRQGRGIEVIEFGDGSTWTLADIMYRGSLTQDAGNNSFGGTAFEDHYIGLAGNDTLNGLGGNDTLNGGTGNDSLVGGAGSDTYVWSMNDGKDTINDASTTSGEADVLILTDLTSSQIRLAKVSGSNDLHLIYNDATARILIQGEYEGATGSKKGIEVIRFADGEEWTQADIWSRARVESGAGNDNIVGSSLIDNFFAGDGNDTISAGLGDDWLFGMGGNDSLKGEGGNDYYKWVIGDGNDTIDDSAASLTEVDVLGLENVASTGAVLSKSGNDLLVTIGTEVITIKNRFETGNAGRGIEKIVFSDGVVIDVLSTEFATVVRNGTTAAETLTGWNYKDSILGGAGNDTLVGNGGDDTLEGGTGADLLQSGNGSDTFIWKKVDGNDNMQDFGTGTGDIDTLILTDVASTDVSLLRGNTGNSSLDDDLRIRINSTGEIINDSDRFQAGVNDGMERIVFSDGVVWTLEDIYRLTRYEGGAGNDLMTGTAIADNINGLAGVDTINGGDGDDTITGGTGNDLLRGAGHDDTYVWSIGDGNDTIDDTSSSFVTLDRLVLTNVLQGQVSLTHGNGTNDLRITIGTEVITINNRFSNIANPYGIERIEFADGSYWNLDEILRQTRMNGGSGNDALSGNGYADNIFGHGGNDTLSGGDGNDTLTGGLGTDSLVGSNGSDSYHWSQDTLAGWNDGNDIIIDSATSLSEVDTLYLHGVDADDVDLQRWASTTDLNVKFNGVEIKVQNQMANAAQHVGIERIVFDDGTIWDYDYIMNNIGTNGTNSANTITGTVFNDKIWAASGNDSVNGGAGNDTFIGGWGADTLNGSSGVDAAAYNTGPAAVIIDLALATAQPGAVGGVEVGDVLIGIENVWGSDLADFGDVLYGNAEANEIRGYKGADYINGRDGSDILKGGNGLDTVYGGNGNDWINGEHNSDILYGEAGDDTIFGHNHNDTLFGGDGNDLLNGNRDSDTMDGGAGADEFRFTVEEGSYGNDIVNTYEDDVDFLSYSLALADEFADFVITGNGTTSVTVAVAGGSVTLNAASAINLTAEDFVFY